MSVVVSLVILALIVSIGVAIFWAGTDSPPSAEVLESLYPLDLDGNDP